MSAVSLLPEPETVTPAPGAERFTLLKPDPILTREVGTAAVLRRGNIEQGKALEILGHALEYLVDSRMFLIEEPDLSAHAEAIQILASLSRTVFAECAEVKPLRRRWRDWIVGRPGTVLAAGDESACPIPVRQVR